MLHNLDLEATQKLMDSSRPRYWSMKYDPHSNTNLRIPDSIKLCFSSFNPTLPQESQSKWIENFNYLRTIDKGTYGAVCLYRRHIQTESQSGSNANTSITPTDLCIKIANTECDLNHDIKILKLLDGDTCLSTIIEHRLIYDNTIDQKKPILLMEHMHGNLLEFFRNVKWANIIDKYIIVMKILIQLNFTFSQLAKKRLYYVDIKLNNCLYVNQDRSWFVKIGDIGSISCADEATGIATYPQIHRHTNMDFYPHVYDVIYGMMILFMEAFSCGSFRIEYRAVKVLSDPFFVNLPLKTKLSKIDTVFQLIGQLNQSAVISYFLQEFHRVVIQPYEIMLHPEPLHLFSNFQSLLIDFYQQLSTEDLPKMYDLDIPVAHATPGGLTASLKPGGMLPPLKPPC